MNHVAFDVPEEKIDEYQQQLKAAGVDVTEVVNHDDSEAGASPEINETTFVRSIYFKDPDRHFAGVRGLDAGTGRARREHRARQRQLTAPLLPSSMSKPRWA